MKKIFSLFIALVLSLSAVAETGVQRTTNSSFEEYRKYLEKSGQPSFAQAYIQLSSVTEMETPLLEQCLEEMYLGAPSQATCLNAVKSLAAKPLNQARREVLFSFLSKMIKVRSTNQNFYQGLRDGLLKTHPKLAEVFHVAIPDRSAQVSDVKTLEMKAWKSALSKKMPIAEAALLINGKKISDLKNWVAPEGIYQWSLVSNTHEPLIRLGTFSQFAAESLKDLKPLAAGGCPELDQLKVQKFGLMNIIVFADRKCIAEHGLSTPIQNPSDHLGNSKSMVNVENKSSRHWVWPVMIAVGVGLAVGLKGKNVQIQSPGSH
jgi:hypothetical protein